jgi:DNA-binding transcriptional ArsR family regulator
MTRGPAARAQADRDAVFRALADPTRRALLDLIREDEKNVSELVAAFDVSQSAISQHLRVLKDADLVHERQSGRQNFYRLNAEPLAIAYDWFAHYTKFWEARLLGLGAHLRKRHAKKDSL